MTRDPDAKPGLSWPSHDAGPNPPPEYRDPRDERRTRRPMPMWDRAKFVVLLAGAWGVMFWTIAAQTPGLLLEEVAELAVREYWWLLALAGVEAVRQLHYLVSETWGGYHQFWMRTVFSRTEERLRRMNDWNRFRIGRVLRVAALVVLASLVLGRMRGVHPAVALIELPVMVWGWLPFVLQILAFMSIIVMQFVALFWFLSRGGVDIYMPEQIKTRFKDVWGQDQVLEKVRENIVYLEDPERIERKGGYVPGGILLWGPPGTGKTLIAEAVAGETGKPFVFVEPGAFINMFIGIGILKVKSLFRKLRKLSLRYGGVIVFFDEADALGNRGSAVSQGAWGGPGASGFSSHPSCNGLSYLSEPSASLVLRSEMHPGDAPAPRQGILNRMIIGAGGGGGGMGTLQALLTELSGLKKPRGFFNTTVRRMLGMAPKSPPKYRILVMMATNMPQSLDEALLRPGRLDRLYKVGYPSKAGRIRTYEGYLSKVRHELTPEEIEKLATITPYATGATIKDLVNEALISSIRDGRDWITWRDVIKAKLLKELGPPDDVEYIERERHAVAIHEACHAVVAYRVRHHLAIDIATIEKGSSYLGMVASIPLEEQFTQWRSEFEADIMVALAALAGERLFFDGDSSSGVRADLAGATALALHMEGFWGMGPSLGSHAVVKGPGAVIETRDVLETQLGSRVEDRLAQLLESARQVLEHDRRHVLALAHALEAHKTVTGDDVAAIIEGREGPLLDGRVYHLPEFVEVAEAYHARALAAHKSHAPIDVPLPQANGSRNGSWKRADDETVFGRRLTDS